MIKEYDIFESTLSSYLQISPSYNKNYVSHSTPRLPTFFSRNATSSSQAALWTCVLNSPEFSYSIVDGTGYELISPHVSSNGRQRLEEK